MDFEAAVSAIRRAAPEVSAVYLFGSRAAGEARPDSDLDLAVLAPRGLDPVARWNLQEEIAGELGVSVDLVDLRRASAVMRAQIVSSAEVLFEGDASERAEFEAIALSDYARLNEERRYILHDIRQRGTIHG